MSPSKMVDPSAASGDAMDRASSGNGAAADEALEGLEAIAADDVDDVDGILTNATNGAAGNGSGSLNGDGADGAAPARPRRGEATPSIQSVERAANILGFFTASRPRLTLSELTARLGMSKATAHRYTMALRQVNLLRYDPSCAEYTLGPQVLVLAGAARAGLPIITVAGPLMEELVRDTNETVVLSIWDGEAPVVVRVDDGTERVIRVSVRAGARLDRFGSAQGRVFCAFLPETNVPDLTDELKRSTKFRSEITAIKESRIGINVSELHGVRTVAAPVFADGEIVAVMALVGTTTTLSDNANSPAARALRRAAERLTDIQGKHLHEPI